MGNLGEWTPGVGCACHKFSLSTKIEQKYYEYLEHKNLSLEVILTWEGPGGQSSSVAMMTYS